MGTRLQLQQLLENLDGSPNAYYQPPSDIRMEYPAVVYERDSSEKFHADNGTYSLNKRYQLTVIERSALAPVADQVEQFPLTTFSRRAVVDGLVHTYFSVYF